MGITASSAKEQLKFYDNGDDDSSSSEEIDTSEDETVDSKEDETGDSNLLSVVPRNETGRIQTSMAPLSLRPGEDRSMSWSSPQVAKLSTSLIQPQRPHSSPEQIPSSKLTKMTDSGEMHLQSVYEETTAFQKWTQEGKTSLKDQFGLSGKLYNASVEEMGTLISPGTTRTADLVSQFQDREIRKIDNLVVWKGIHVGWFLTVFCETPFVKHLRNFGCELWFFRKVCTIEIISRTFNAMTGKDHAITKTDMVNPSKSIGPLVNHIESVINAWGLNRQDSIVSESATLFVSYTGNDTLQFLIESLRSSTEISMDDYFWMDIFCVDQSACMGKVSQANIPRFSRAILDEFPNQVAKMQKIVIVGKWTNVIHMLRKDWMIWDLFIAARKNVKLIVLLGQHKDLPNYIKTEFELLQRILSSIDSEDAINVSYYKKEAHQDSWVNEALRTRIEQVGFETINKAVSSKMREWVIQNGREYLDHHVRKHETLCGITSDDCRFLKNFAKLLLDHGDSKQAESYFEEAWEGQRRLLKRHSPPKHPFMEEACPQTTPKEFQKWLEESPDGDTTLEQQVQLAKDLYDISMGSETGHVKDVTYTNDIVEDLRKSPIPGNEKPLDPSFLSWKGIRRDWLLNTFFGSPYMRQLIEYGCELWFVRKVCIPELIRRSSIQGMEWSSEFQRGAVYGALIKRIRAVVDTLNLDFDDDDEKRPTIGGKPTTFISYTGSCTLAQFIDGLHDLPHVQDDDYVWIDFLCMDQFAWTGRGSAEELDGFREIFTRELRVHLPSFTRTALVLPRWQSLMNALQRIWVIWELFCSGDDSNSQFDIVLVESDPKYTSHLITAEFDVVQQLLSSIDAEKAVLRGDGIHARNESAVECIKDIGYDRVTRVVVTMVREWIIKASQSQLREIRRRGTRLDLMLLNNLGLLLEYHGRMEEAQKLFLEAWTGQKPSTLDEDTSPTNDDDQENRTRLHVACRDSSTNYSLLEDLVRNSPWMLRRSTTDGSTPLHVLCRNGPDFAAVKIVVKGWEPAVGVANQYGWLPIHCAFAHGASTQVLKYLIEQSKSSLSKTTYTYNETVLHLAFGKAPQVSVGSAMNSSFYEAVLFLFESEPEIAKNLAEAKNWEGKIPCHVACRVASWDLVNLFIEKVPSLGDVRDREDRTPSEILRTLEEHKKRGLEGELDNEGRQKRRMTSHAESQTVDLRALGLVDIGQGESKEVSHSLLDPAMEKLKMTGCTVAVTAESTLDAAKTARDLARYWKSRSKHRYVLCLNVVDDKLIHADCEKAVTRLSEVLCRSSRFNVASKGRTNHDRLLEILTSLSSPLEWLVLFENCNGNVAAKEWFFRESSNWWNSPARFLFAASQRGLQNLQEDLGNISVVESKET